MVGDVPKDTAAGTLQHVAAKASGGLTMVDGGLYYTCDGVDHGIHRQVFLQWSFLLRRVLVPTTGNNTYAECQRLCQVHNIEHSAAFTFAECFTKSPRQKPNTRQN